jgi:hypothetical protein
MKSTDSKSTFKSILETGGLSGLFGGMKVKGPALGEKPKVAQT